jgi:hypothetical protein
MNRSSLIFLGAMIILCACTPNPPTDAELQTMRTAVRPSSPEAAQAAVRAYFEKSLFDPAAAQYRFSMPPIMGRATVQEMRKFGWFMCGDVNGKNRMGGYGGYRPFFAHFAPSQPDKVDDATIADTSETLPVLNGWCRGLYGTAWDSR